MKICRTASSLKTWRRKLKSSLGFVPTMGALHEGHLSLIRKAKKECEEVAVSIFVNPTQFGPKEDFDSYPRQEARDLSLLKQEKVSLVFIPKSRLEIYPRGEEGFRVQAPTKLASILEGRFRPHFFHGVTDVVLRLFELTRPDRAYFGEKDYQQLCVIRAMVEDLFLPVQIRSCPTLREASGLAMSSRNAYLRDEQRAKAAELFHCIRSESSVAKALSRLSAHSFRVDYLEVWDNRLENKLSHAKGRWLVAATFDQVRLIDNVDRSK